MGNSFERMTLSDAGVSVLDCEHKTPQAVDDGFPYIAIPDIQEGRVVLETTRKISQHDLLEWNRRHTPQEGDVIVTRRGRVGDSAPIPPGLSCAIGQNLVLLRSNDSLVRQSFLKWAVRSPQWWHEVDRLTNVGAVFSSLNVRDISKIRLDIPDSSTQLAIVEVLDALDDKIDANTKLAKTSDELAGTLFRRALLSSSYSDRTFNDIAQVSGGGTPSTKTPEFWDGEIAWATPTDVTALAGPYLESTSRTITEAGLNACASGLFPPGSILMTSRATIGAFALAQVPTAVNQGFIVVQPNDPSLHFWIFHEMRSRVDEFISLANGATFLELSRSNFKKFKVRKAAPEIMTDFNSVAADLHNHARAALRENEALSATRDTLLPLLMSGKLRVKDAEKIVEDAV